MHETLNVCTFLLSEILLYECILEMYLYKGGKDVHCKIVYK